MAQEINVSGRPLGGTMLEQVKTMNKKPARINKEFKMPVIHIEEGNNPKYFICTCCGKKYTKQEGNFLKAGSSVLWQANKGYMPVCKKCAETLFRAYTDFFSGNEEKSLKLLCCMFDMFYDEQASSMAATHVRPGGSRFTYYPSKTNTIQVKSKGSTFLDTIRREVGESYTINSVDDAVTPDDENDDTYKVTKDIIKKWGCGLKAEEYEWLDEQESDWLSRVECKSKAQEELIRTICIAQLNIRRAQQGTGKITDAMKAFQDLLASCNLQPRQNADNDLSEQNTFGTLIRQIEQDRPIPEPLEEWKDVDGIKNYIDTFFLGHLCNLVHVNNDYEDKYKHEMEKYTVTPPVYENDDDAVDVSLLDKYSNKGESKE